MSTDVGGRSVGQTVRSVAVVPSHPALEELLAALPFAEVHGEVSAPPSSLCYRSGDAAPGALFFCIPGLQVDGHDFAAEAVVRGATVLLVERLLPLEVPQVLVPSVREAMGPISAAFHGHPAERLTMVGVTGTNGKTTTTFLLESVFRAAGLTPGVIGTTGVRIDGDHVPFPRTTPESPDLQALLARMIASGVDAAAMEVSSHGLHQHRVDGIRYRAAVFTNLTQDHLDYHASMEEYFEAKARLFTPALADHAVVNIDAPEGRRLLRPDLPTTTFGLERSADVRATDVRTTLEGLAFRVDEVEIRSSLRGLFNVENCLAALAVARVLGISDETVARGIADVRGVPGRVEPVEAGQDFLVLVDYAHTPDSLENVLRAARPLSSGRLLVVFGCGGDRDRGKRPLMGEVATSLADVTVVTSDNPRSEDPATIVDQIVQGAVRGGGSYVVELDRRSAIRFAVREALPGDIVVIAGKGHEPYQELADRTIPFDDRTVAAEEIRAAEDAG
jgi:UDP-N-acetylmuramoyl-L-alanyl-D-glutamate--2,6-diaminopimelate ligase